MERSPAAQALIDYTRRIESEVEQLRDLADEYNRLIRHMDAGGDFFAFQAAEAVRRNASGEQPASTPTNTEGEQG